MNIFIICSVRKASDRDKLLLEYYVNDLESQGNNVHLPHRDTNQEASGIEICSQNKEAIKKADEIHVFYSNKSEGTLFDLGVAFAMNKKIRVAKNIKYGLGKSFPRMIDEWEQQTMLYDMEKEGLEK